MIPPVIAYDTETDRPFSIPDRFWRLREYEELQRLVIESTRTVLVQICSVDAESPEDVILYEGEDAIEQFITDFEMTTYDVTCHAFNLGKYEYRWLKKALINHGYEFVERPKRKKDMQSGKFTIFADDKDVYSMTVRSWQGHTLTITDDKKRLGGESMKSCAEMIRKRHPEWFDGIQEVKLHVEEYNNQWYYHRNGYEDFIKYSKQDAFSQALIARHLIESGMDKSLTAQGWAMAQMLLTKYNKERSPQGLSYAKRDFRRYYPPLNREMQDIVEKNLMGGFVWGLVGDHHGRFCHGDYKSSYPYEYAYGKLFIGHVCRTSPGDPDWKHGTSDHFKHWYYLSFDFTLLDTGIPSLTGAQCEEEEEWTKKLRAGHCDHILLDEVLFEELTYSYDIENVIVHEVWYSKKLTGGFESTTRMYFEQKESAQKGTLEKALAKLCLNGAQHGKTITKTNRRNRMIDEFGEDHFSEVINSPDYCAMIGFTGMQLARARLLRHCRMLKEAGHEIYMCDTDSFVTDGTPEECEAIIGREAFIHDGDVDMKDTLGKIEWETDKEGSRTFDHFKCWGLKMYLEENDGKYRKSAFKGMHDDVQKSLLPSASTDGRVYMYIQSGTVHTSLGVVVAPIVKHFHAEDVFAKEEDEILKELKMLKDIRKWEDEMYKEEKKMVRIHGCKEDIKAYLKDTHYEEDDAFYYAHTERAYIQKMWEDIRAEEGYRWE